MIRKIAKPGLATVTEFARAIGVSQPAVSQAIQAGRLQPYDFTGRPVSYDFRGRKFLKLKEAKVAFEHNRVRLDNWFLDR
jgi:DNA-binding transcriptional ArsR family regulator